MAFCFGQSSRFWFLGGLVMTGLFFSFFKCRGFLALRNSQKAMSSPLQNPLTTSIVQMLRGVEWNLLGGWWVLVRIGFLKFSSSYRKFLGFVFLVGVIFLQSSFVFAESLNGAAVDAVGGSGAGSDGVVKSFDRSKFIAPPSRFMRKPIDKTPEKKLREVSDMYEKHFLREMTKAMRSTVHESGFIQVNQAEKIFREQLDDHYVEKWGEKGGIGLSDMIYKQLVDKFGAQMGIKPRVEKPHGPLPLDGGNRAKSFQHPGKSKSTLSYRIDIAPEIQGNAPRPGARDVKAPWGGVFVAMKTLEDNSTELELEHDNGLKSQVVFKGTLSKLSTGQKVQAGDTLGFLSSEAKSIYWTVETDKTPRPQTVSE